MCAVLRIIRYAHRRLCVIVLDRKEFPGAGGGGRSSSLEVDLVRDPCCRWWADLNVLRFLPRVSKCS